MCVDIFRIIGNDVYLKCSDVGTKKKRSKMWHFHLTKYWFDQIKNGSKTTEYRILTERLKKQLAKDALKPFGWSAIRFYCGYPKKNDFSKVLTASLYVVRYCRFYELPVDVREFFIKQKNIVQLFDDSVFLCFEFGGVRNVV